VRVLVTAASRHDATREIAETIADGLRRRGVDAEARPLDEVVSLDGFDAVVLGSAIYMGRWLKTAREFVSACVSARAGRVDAGRPHARAASKCTTRRLMQAAGPVRVSVLPCKLTI
jgi:menaquinone-dependent protoporphyrinogen IX oxidase